MIKGVTFDFGDTLAKGAFDKSKFRKKLFNYLQTLGYSGNQNLIINLRNQMLQKLERARKFHREIRLEDLYSSLLFKIGIHPETKILSQIHDIYVESFETKMVPNAEEVLEYLKRKYKIAIISNSMSNVPRINLQKAGFETFFDAIVISRDIGIRKPDPDIFNFSLSKLSIKAKEAIHIGDSLEHDVKGAKNIGMSTIWVKSDNEQLIIQPDYIIYSIKELESIL